MSHSKASVTRVTVVVAKEAARLAALIGEPMPHVDNVVDLIEYANYATAKIQERAFFDQDQIDDLLLRLDPDSWWRAQREAHQRMQRKMNRQNGMKTVHAKGTEKTKLRGDETRARIALAAARVAHLPERQQAGTIARQLGITAHQIRRIRKTTTSSPA